MRFSAVHIRDVSHKIMSFIAARGYACVTYAVMRWLCVCLSVCLSVTFVNSVRTSIPILKLFSSSDSQAILVFLYQTTWQYSDSNPLTGRRRSNAGWVG